MHARLWTFNDIKDATARHELYRNSNNPIRHYFYGVALEMSGQADDADEKYVAFRAEVKNKFGDLGSGAAHYSAEAATLSSGGDERTSEHYANMARILTEPGPGSGRAKICALM